jgi:hypothetical protein
MRPQLDQKGRLLKAPGALTGDTSRSNRYTLAAGSERLEVAVGRIATLQRPSEMVAVNGGSNGPVPVSSRKETVRS